MMCRASEDPTSDFSWTQGQGSTPSELTGPQGAYSGSNYIFIEASNVEPGKEAT